MNLYNIFSVFRHDWKRVLKNPIALIVVGGICIIPAFYAWVNIQACWNVYDNTNNIPVAVVNSDKPVQYRGQTINVGKQIVKGLQTNKKIHWVFTNSKDADMGLIDSTYYATIEIPSDFSAKLLTVMSKNPQKPQITYKVDTKVNPVANKITSAANTTLIQQVTSEFISTVNEVAFTSVNRVGKDAGKDTETVLKTKDAIVSLSRNLQTIDESLGTIQTGSGNLNTLLSSVSSSMPAIQSSLATVGKTNADNQQVLATLQNSMDKSSQNMGMNLQYMESSNRKVQGLLADLNTAADSAATTKANTAFPIIGTQLSSMNQSIDATVTYLEQCRDYDYDADVARAISDLGQLRSSLVTLRSAMVQAQSDVSTLQTETDKAYDELKTATAQEKADSKAVDAQLATVISELETLYKVNPSTELKNAIDTLKQIQSEQLGDKLGVELDKVLATQTATDATLKSLYDSLTTAIGKTDVAINRVDDAITFLQHFKSTSLATRRQQLNSIITDLNAIKPYVADAQSQLDTLRSQAVAGSGLSRQTLDLITQDCGRIATQMSTALKLYDASVRTDLKTISTQLTTTMRYTGDLINSAQGLSKQIGSMVSSAQEGTQLSAAFSGSLRSRLEEFKNVVGALGKKLDTVNNNDIIQIISIMQNDPKLMGNYIVEPFEIHEESVYPIPNYGSGMTPLYTTLAIWVGCLMLNAVLKAEVAYFPGAETLSLREKHFGKMLLFCSMSMIQGTIIAIGDIALLKVHVMEPSLFIFTCIYSSLVFSIITFTLMATLGNVGKALGIIYLIMQVAGSGGSYPIQLDPPIFRILQPFFPFTYTLSALREAIGGVQLTAVVGDMVGLSVFAVLFWLFGFFMVRRLREKFHPFEVAFKKSGLGE